jgi:hypothetical protein
MRCCASVEGWPLSSIAGSNSARLDYSTILVSTRLLTSLQHRADEHVIKQYKPLELLVVQGACLACWDGAARRPLKSMLQRSDCVFRQDVSHRTLTHVQASAYPKRYVLIVAYDFLRRDSYSFSI